MTRRERMERRAALRSEWAESATKKSERYFRASRAATEGIPFGQPVLVGHHSERHHRRALEKSDTAMRNACENTAKASRHSSIAATLEDRLERTIFSDDANAIQALEAKAAGCRALAELYKRANVAWKKSKGSPDFWKLLDPRPTDEELRGLAYQLRGHVAMWGDRLASNGRPLQLKYPLCSTTSPAAEARRCLERIKQIRHQNARSERAEASGGVLIEGEAWVSVTFAEKPERDVLETLKAAGFRWAGGSWIGERAKLPESLNS